MVFMTIVRWSYKLTHKRWPHIIADYNRNPRKRSQPFISSPKKSRIIPSDPSRRVFHKVRALCPICKWNDMRCILACPRKSQQGLVPCFPIISPCFLSWFVNSELVSCWSQHVCCFNHHEILFKSSCVHLFACFNQHFLAEVTLW